MAKIGRNEICPCGSGLKYKRCCALHKDKQTPPPQQQQNQQSLMTAVKYIQHEAAKRNALFRVFGVFFFFITKDGDAWLLEMTDSDAIQLAQAGKALSVPIVEDEKRIEVNWSHHYVVRNQKLQLTAYAGGQKHVVDSTPIEQLSMAIKGIHKRLSRRELNKLHLVES